jgi:septum formation protein
MKFILASSSPRRRELLLRLQTPFDIILPDVDESIIPPDGSPETYCTALAELKANDISQHYPNNLVIGSDTIVVLDDQIMGKPEDKAMAQNMLETLSGKTHHVYTGVCLKWADKNIHHLFAEITMVTFRELSEADINHYIESCPPYDKAGSYGIQDWSAVFVKEIKGCYDNVVGFPISRFYEELKKLGINLLDSLSEAS